MRTLWTQNNDFACISYGSSSRTSIEETPTETQTQSPDISPVLTVPSIHQEIIDIDNLLELAPEPTCVSNKDQNRPIPCYGFELKIPQEQSPYTSYPFALHTEGKLPWTITFHGERLFLVADGCTKRCYMVPCTACSSISRHNIVSGIIHRINFGASEHTPWKWLSIDQLLEVNSRLSRQNKQLRLNSLNMARKLTSRITVLDEHKRFLLCIASGK